jgi:hypothetical protein
MAHDSEDLSIVSNGGEETPTVINHGIDVYSEWPDSLDRFGYLRNAMH